MEQINGKFNIMVKSRVPMINQQWMEEMPEFAHNFSKWLQMYAQLWAFSPHAVNWIQGKMDISFGEFKNYLLFLSVLYNLLGFRIFLFA